MFEVLRRFVAGRSPAREEAEAALRLVYLLAFGVQLLVAVLVGVVLALLLGSKPFAPAVTLVLLALGVLTLPAAPAVARLAARGGGRSGALAGAIALGVVLATPGWFLVLGLLLTIPPLYLFALLAVLAAGYALGLVLAARFARLAQEEDAGT